MKYIGPLPGKSDQYLGLELEDEGKTSSSVPEKKKTLILLSIESKHDGVYQGQRLFQW